MSRYTWSVRDGCRMLMRCPKEISRKRKHNKLGSFPSSRVLPHNCAGQFVELLGIAGPCWASWKKTTTKASKGHAGDGRRRPQTRWPRSHESHGRSSSPWRTNAGSERVGLTGLKRGSSGWVTLIFHPPAGLAWWQRAE